MKEVREKVGCAALLLIAIHAAGAPVSAQKGAAGNDKEVSRLIGELYTTRWLGIQMGGMSPAGWIVHLTRPQEEILKIGPAAQEALLQKLPDPLIRDQVLFLLGGAGDERVIEPIIESMIDEGLFSSTPNAFRINQAATFALTNITTAAVVWQQGGGNIVKFCSNEEEKACWRKWWEGNRASFSVKKLTAKDREYQLYPNYGIYKISNSTGIWREPYGFPGNEK